MGEPDLSFDRQVILVSGGGGGTLLVGSFGSFLLATSAASDGRATAWLPTAVWTAVFGIASLLSMDRLRIRAKLDADGTVRLRITRKLRTTEASWRVGEILGADCHHWRTRQGARPDRRGKVWPAHRATIRVVTRSAPVDLLTRGMWRRLAVDDLARDLDAYLRALPGVGSVSPPSSSPSLRLRPPSPP